jgi:hypothetical protein
VLEPDCVADLVHEQLTAGHAAAEARTQPVLLGGVEDDVAGVDPRGSAAIGVAEAEGPGGTADAHRPAAVHREQR